MMTKEQLTFRIRFYFFLLLGLLSLPVYAFMNAGLQMFYILIPAIVAMQVYLLVRLKRVQLLQLIFLYIFLYFIFLIPYFCAKLQLSEHTEFQQNILFEKVLFLFYLFYTGACIASAWNINPNKKQLKDSLSLNVAINERLLLVALLFFAFIFLFRQGVNVLESDSPYLAYRENLNNGSTLPLYIILFLFFVPYVFSLSRTGKLIFNISCSILAYYCLTRGFRMVLAPLVFCYFFHYFDLRFKFKYLISLFVIGLIMMGVINSIKMGQNFKLIYLLTENGDFILSHHADSLYASASAFGLVENGKITFLHRILLSLGFLCESIIPPTFLPDIIKYPHILGLFTQTGGGGLFISGAYLMWGGLGVLITGFLLVYVFRQVYRNESVVLKIFVCILFVFAPRWISYDFHIILRFTMLGLVEYYFLKYVHFTFHLRSVGLK